MSYTTGSRYSPNSEKESGSLEYVADELIKSTGECDKYKSFQKVMCLIRCGSFSSLFEYRIISIVKRKLRVK